MLDFDAVWHRVAGKERYRGWDPRNLVVQSKVLTLAVSASGSQTNQPVQFPGGAIILGITASASADGQTALQTTREALQMFSFTIAEQVSNRSIVGTAAAVGESVFGQLGNQFPPKEIEIDPNNALMYTVNNLTSTAITVSFTHHCIINAAQG